MFIKHPTILKGEFVELLPLEEKHIEELKNIANDKRIYEFLGNDFSDEEDFIKDGKKRAYLFNTALQSEKTLDFSKLDLKEDLKQRLFDFEFKKMKEYYKNKRFLKMKKSLST